LKFVQIAEEFCKSEWTFDDEGTLVKRRVTESLWEAIAPLLPEPVPSPKGGRPPVPNRDCLEGIIFVLRTGMPWQMLPTELGFGSGSTCWRRFRAWTKLGVWPQLHQHLLRVLGRHGKIDLERAVIDSASMRALKGGPTPARTPRIAAKRAVSVTS
jgi:transposase